MTPKIKGKVLVRNSAKSRPKERQRIYDYCYSPALYREIESSQVIWDGNSFCRKGYEEHGTISVYRSIAMEMAIMMKEGIFGHTAQVAIINSDIWWCARDSFHGYGKTRGTDYWDRRWESIGHINYPIPDGMIRWNIIDGMKDDDVNKIWPVCRTQEEALLAYCRKHFNIRKPGPMMHKYLIGHPIKITPLEINEELEGKGKNDNRIE